MPRGFRNEWQPGDPTDIDGPIRKREFKLGKDDHKLILKALEEAIECVGEFVDVFGNEWRDGTPLNTKYEEWQSIWAAADYLEKE